MKVTIQYYDEKPQAKIDAVAVEVKKAGLQAETVRSDFQTVEVADLNAAKALMAKLSPIANIQIQTA